MQGLELGCVGTPELLGFLKDPQDPPNAPLEPLRRAGMGGPSLSGMDIPHSSFVLEV